MLVKVTRVKIASKVIGTVGLKGVIVKWTLGWFMVIVDISTSWIILTLILLRSR